MLLPAKYKNVLNNIREQPWDSCTNFQIYARVKFNNFELLFEYTRVLYF